MKRAILIALLLPLAIGAAGAGGLLEVEEVAPCPDGGADAGSCVDGGP